MKENIKEKSLNTQQLASADTRTAGVTQPANRTEQKELSLPERRAELEKKTKDIIICRKCSNRLLDIRPGLKIEDLEYVLAKHKCQDNQKSKDKMLDKAYQEWANDIKEQAEIKAWTNTELDGWDNKIDKQNSKELKLTKISGVLTSNIHSRKKSKVPHMAFIRVIWNDNLPTLKGINGTFVPEKHTLEECQAQKCKECEIPVIFRIKGALGEWLEPIFEKGDKLELTGKFEAIKNKKSNRPSFTCYSYQIINDHE